MKPMRIRTFTPTLLLALGLATLFSQAGATAVAPRADTDVRVIRQRMGAWTQAYNRGDVQGMLDVLTDDYVEDTQGEPGSVGKRELGQNYAVLFSKYDAHITCIMEKVYTQGDMGFDRGRYTVTYTSKASGKHVSLSGHYMEVWALQDGVWRVRYETAIPDPTPVVAM